MLITNIGYFTYKFINLNIFNILNYLKGDCILDNFFEIFKSISSLSNKNHESQNVEIPKEIKDQYPYGEFPIQYTKSGQETIRKQSENRFSYSEEKNNSQPENAKPDANQLSLLLPIIQMLSSNKKNPKDLMQVFGKLLFKDNPDLQRLFNLMPKVKSQEIKTEESFPNTNKVNINSLKRID